MTDSFSIENHDHGSYTVLSFSGAFASTGFAHLREALKKALAGGDDSESYIVIDISRATLLTSSCLEAIYMAKKEGESKRRHCIIVAPTPDMQELFAVTGFDKFVPVYTSMDNFLSEKGLA